MLTFMLFPATMTLLYPLFSSSADTTSFFRIFILLASGGLIAYLIPSELYHTVGMRRSGIYYAMLPASKSEKLWSQVLTSIVVCPLIVWAVAFLIDCLLAVFRVAAWKQFLWNLDEWQMVGSWQMGLMLGGYLLGAAARLLLNTFDQNLFWVKVLRVLVFVWLVVGMIFPILLASRIPVEVPLLVVELLLAVLVLWLLGYRLDKMQY